MGMVVAKIILGTTGVLFLMSLLAYICNEVDKNLATKRRLKKWKQSQEPRVIIDNEWVKWTQK
jgi:hypothetical protein